MKTEVIVPTGVESLKLFPGFFEFVVEGHDDNGVILFCPESGASGMIVRLPTDNSRAKRKLFTKLDAPNISGGNYARLPDGTKFTIEV